MLFIKQCFVNYGFKLQLRFMINVCPCHGCESETSGLFLWSDSMFSIWRPCQAKTIIGKSWCVSWYNFFTNTQWTPQTCNAWLCINCLIHTCIGTYTNLEEFGFIEKHLCFSMQQPARSQHMVAVVMVSPQPLVLVSKAVLRQER